MLFALLPSPPLTLALFLDSLQVASKRWGRSGDLLKKAEAKKPEEVNPAAEGEETVSFSPTEPTESERSSSAEAARPAPRVREQVLSPAPAVAEVDTEKRRLADSLFATEETSTPSTRRETKRSRAKKGRAF